VAVEVRFPELETSGLEQAIAGTTQRPSKPFFGVESAYLAIIYAVLIVAAVIAIVPFVFVVSTSLKETIALFSYPPEWLPKNPTFANYRTLLDEYAFGRWLFNSFFVAGSVTIIKVIIDSMAGYAFAKMDFPGRNGLFVVVLLTLMIPFSATLIPLFLIVRDFHLTNTYWGLILPSLANPIGIFMMRQFIESLPSDLEKAARLDGCNEFQIYLRVILPLTRASLIVLAVFTFMNQWTSYLWPLVVSTKPEMYTLTVGVQSLKALFAINWGVLSAGAVLSMLPLIIVFLFLQRFFITGSIAGALKE
jgi:ABC-type glycerol-3-phosphate transport system permease component